MELFENVPDRGGNPTGIYHACGIRIFAHAVYGKNIRIDDIVGLTGISEQYGSIWLLHLSL